MDLLKLSQFPSVAANAVSTLVTNELIDKSVHALIFEMGGTFTKAQITDLQIRCNGKHLCESISGDKLQSMNSYAGLPDTTNYLFFWFGDPTATTIRGQHMGDLDLSVYRSPLEIRATIGAATSPTLQVYALVGTPKAEMLLGYTPGEIATIRALVPTVVQPAAAVTRQQVPISIGQQAGAKLRSLGLFHTNLSSVELRKNGFIKYDNIATALNTAIEAEFARTAQSGLYMLDRVMDGNQGESEMTADGQGNAYPFQVFITTSAADTITAFADVHALMSML